ncbi:hypothetical protein FGO68_gene2850 [Halteria grandinella]|uniref:Uncharacterized protein n=1 Tax=Halteria grandinella TaxID=5974 RepID=A0A8J8TAC3_HALGN|nr:hypothetical protein FGO68_gene2850 [Halteria grandinella]
MLDNNISHTCKKESMLLPIQQNGLLPQSTKSLSISLETDSLTNQRSLITEQEMIWLSSRTAIGNYNLTQIAHTLFQFQQSSHSVTWQNSQIKSGQNLKEALIQMIKQQQIKRFSAHFQLCFQRETYASIVLIYKQMESQDLSRKSQPSQSDTTRLIMLKQKIAIEKMPSQKFYASFVKQDL